MHDLAQLQVLSVHQPWASLLVWGLKVFETRTWFRASLFQAPLLIHAGKAFPSAYKSLGQDPHFARAFEVMGELDALPRGAVVGVVHVVDYYRAEDVRDSIGNAERAFGDYRPGRWVWLTALQHARRFNQPVEAPGYQRLFRPRLWPKDVQDAVAAQLAAVSPRKE